MDLRKAIRGVGKMLISFGVLLFLFVAYQLWGTGIAEARGQKALGAAFEQRQLTTQITLPRPSGEAPPVTAPPAPELGQSAALLEIPKIDLKKYVVEGVEVEDLKKGPGHYPDTPMPGEKGNAAIAGHRTTYGAPFYDLGDLNAGDQIFVTTPAGRFQYDVMETKLVSPDDSWVLDSTPDDRLTLTTCHPKFSAAQRMIIVAGLKSTPVESDPTPPADADRVLGGGDPASEQPRAQLSAGLSGERANKVPALLWGSFAAAIWFGAWLVGRFWRKWPAYLLAAPAFFVVLFVFYENVARLLPANV